MKGHKFVLIIKWNRIAAVENMKKNYSTADMQLVSNTTGLSPSPVETLTALKTKRAIRQSYSASDLNSMDTLPSIDLCMYLLRLKCKTRKLNLDTRRPSYMEWRADLKRYRSESMYDQDSNRGVPNDEDFKKINTCLNWIREELVRNVYVQDLNGLTATLR